MVLLWISVNFASILLRESLFESLYGLVVVDMLVFGLIFLILLFWTYFRDIVQKPTSIASVSYSILTTAILLTPPPPFYIVHIIGTSSLVCIAYWRRGHGCATAFAQE